MSFAASFLATATFRDIIKTAIDVNWGNASPDVLKLALFDDTITPSADTDPLKYDVAPWDSGEVDGTGWSAGGVTLSTPTCTAASGALKLDAADVSEDGTTLTGARGCLIYDSTTSDYGLVAVTFGDDYDTVDGTFGITFDATGIAIIDLTP